MAYKKYIKRGEKVYGPYIYHSRRENGQVITEYHGKKSQKSLFKIFLFIFVAVFILIGLYSLIFNLHLFNFTGLASLQLATNYKPNEPVEGILRLSLLKGELIPENTNVIVNLGEEQKNYSLVELVSESGFEGNYYINNVAISGSGLGYGVQGAKYSYPEVSFKLNVVDISNETTEESGTETETSTSETSSSESNVSETESTQTEQINKTQENSGETLSEAQENETTSETPPETTSTITSGTTQNTETPTENTPASAENIETTQTPESSTDTSEQTSESTPAENTEVSPTGMTGGIIKFFTGLVSMNLAQEEIDGDVEGKVIYGENVEYKIPEGKTAVLIEGSVSSEGKTIDDSYVDVSVSNGITTISTNYRQAEYGFGQDYVSDEKIYYDINLSKLDLTAKQGKMDIKLIYNNLIISETSSDLSVSEFNISEQNISTAEPFVLENSSIYDLTQDEIKLLIKKTGTNSVNTTKSEIFNKRFVIKYELGDYWTEFSYDYDGKISEELLDKIELERKYWLKNLVKELSKETSEAENVGDLVVGFSLNESNKLKIGKENISEEIEKEIKEKNNTEEAQTQEIEENITENVTEEIPAENSSEVLDNETAQTETPTELENSTSENTMQNAVAETPVENTEQTSIETTPITGQIVSQPESQTNLFDKIKRFFGKTIRDIREAFS